MGGQTPREYASVSARSALDKKGVISKMIFSHCSYGISSARTCHDWGELVPLAWGLSLPTAALFFPGKYGQKSSRVRYVARSVRCQSNMAIHMHKHF